MRLLAILAAMLLVVLLTNCNKNDELTGDSTFTLNDTLELAINKSAINNENQLTIAIDSVLGDSRCPADVVCVWEGNAEVRFIFTNNTQEIKFVLNTNKRDNFQSDTIIDGYSIHLVDLKPYPESTREIKPDEYVAELLIKKQ